MRINELLHTFFDGRHMLAALPELAQGLLVTVEIAGLCLAVGISLGLVLAVVRVTIARHGNPLLVRLLNVPLVFYVDAVRAIPPLVTLVVVYFALPYLGIFLPRFWSAVMVFVLVLAAFAEEIFRAGIESIDPGQMEAARSQGLTFLQAMAHVIVPQAFRVAVPPLTSRMISITKDVSLASVIGVSDLLKAAKLDIARSGNYSSLVAAAIMFTLLFLPLVRLSGLVERRLR
ncbi:MAG: amino acid ABC transporter permease [Candidatus Bipolaricaulaceae bacterium]